MPRPKTHDVMVGEQLQSLQEVCKKLLEITARRQPARAIEADARREAVTAAGTLAQAHGSAAIALAVLAVAQELRFLRQTPTRRPQGGRRA